MKLTLLAIILALAVSACGPEEDGGIDLSVYSGTFALTETFNRVEGAGCSEPAVKIFENGVRILIESSEFEARFDERWSTLYGEIHDDSAFLGAKIETDRRFEFSGIYSDEDHLSGIIKDHDGPCTKHYDVVGTRSLP